MQSGTIAGLNDFRSGAFSEAFHAWTMAAVGDADAALFLGVLYDTGEGVEQDQSEAAAWYRRAAEEGSAVGAFNLGVMHDSGRGVPRDEAVAAHWYGVAAAAGFARAQYNLALLYDEGVGVKRDGAQATRLFRDAARQGLGAARAHLAALGVRVAGPVRVPSDTALDEFRQAQQALLSRGPAETARAAALFARAAKARNPMAEYDLGYCYENGIGIGADPARAYAWYRRAARTATSADLTALAAKAAQGLKGRLSQQQIALAQEQIAGPP